MQFSTLAVALFASTTLVSVTSSSYRTDRLRAEFDFGTDLQATVTVRQSRGQKEDNAASWKVRINEFNIDLCPLGELNWHVHEYPVVDTADGIRDVNADLSTSASACGGPVTGGHYDPTFACGGASQNNAGPGPLDADGEPTTGGVCAILRAQDQTFPVGSAETGKVKAADSYAACSMDNQSSCEIGDQSAKLGKLDATKRSNQRFTDEWMTPIDTTLEGRSLVLHCCYEKTDGSGTSCSPRLACANLL